MTEAEAKTKWCPMARVLLPVNQAGNRISTFHLTLSDPRDREHYEKQRADCNCLGSGCAAWRWKPQTDAGDWLKGFCGLAGQPVAK